MFNKEEAIKDLKLLKEQLLLTHCELAAEIGIAAMTLYTILDGTNPRDWAPKTKRKVLKFITTHKKEHNVLN